MNMFPGKAVVAAGLVGLALVALPATAANNATALAAINAGSAAFLKAYNSGDADAVLTHFEDTAIVMPPGMAPIRGRAQIRQFVEKGIAGAKANGITLALGDTTDVGVSGNLGWHSGPFTATNSVGVTLDTGKYLETWRKSGGQWRMIRRIWNSNHPTPASAPAPLPTAAPASK